MTVYNLKQFKELKTAGNSYAVIGNPVGHSVSPFLHGILNKNCAYYAVKVLPEELEEFCSAAAEKLKGFNITVPYKKDIIKYLYEIDGISEDSGSVNTVVSKGGRLYGYNTDVYGMKAAFEINGISVKGKNVLILGAGGAACAALKAMRNGGASVTVAARDTVKAEQALGGASVKDVNAVKGNYDIVINCTPCGMKGQEETAAINIRNISGCNFLYDTVYNPLRTKLMREAQSLGIKTDNGLNMLIYQGIKAQQIWGNNVQTSAEINQMLKAEIIRQRLNEKGKTCIALCGFMGCGKTAAAKRISEILGFRRLDTDEIIEKNAGQTISQIFEAFGEARFRETESQTIYGIDYSQNSVISLGGGAVTREDNVKKLKENCLLVYIDVPFDECLKRADNGDRPLLKSGKEEARRLYNLRKEIYKSVCDIEVKGRNTPGETAEEIIYSI
jgi:shikimate dehydrogenase